MADSKIVDELLDAFAKVLLRCVALGYLVVLLWLIVYVGASDLLYSHLGGRLFGVSQHEVDMVCFCGITVMKGVVFLFFLCPYIAIRLVLRTRTTK